MLAAQRAYKLTWLEYNATQDIGEREDLLYILAFLEKLIAPSHTEFMTWAFENLPRFNVFWELIQMRELQRLTEEMRNATKKLREDYNAYRSQSE